MMLFKRRERKHLNQPKFEALQNSYVAKANQVIWRNVEGRGVILNSKNASYYTLEGTALRIWELIDKGIIVSELVETISNEYAKNAEVVKRDLAEILASMKREGIIELKSKEGLNAEEK